METYAIVTLYTLSPGPGLMGTSETFFVGCASNAVADIHAALPRAPRPEERIRSHTMSKADWLREIQWHSHTNKVIWQ